MSTDEIRRSLMPRVSMLLLRHGHVSRAMCHHGTARMRATSCGGSHGSPALLIAL